MRLLAVVMVTVLSAGCYTYVPVASASFERGAAVRVTLDSPRSIELGSMSIHNVVKMNAEVIRWEDDEVLLSAFWLYNAAGHEFPGDGWTVRLPEAAIGYLERKQISKMRTGGLVGAAVLFGLLGNYAFPGGGLHPGGDGSPPVSH